MVLFGISFRTGVLLSLAGYRPREGGGSAWLPVVIAVMTAVDRAIPGSRSGVDAAWFAVVLAGLPADTGTQPQRTRRVLRAVPLFAGLTMGTEIAERSLGFAEDSGAALSGYPGDTGTVSLARKPG